MNQQEIFVKTTQDLLRLLDTLLEPRKGDWWNRFFTDRSRPCPFFVDFPDENLVEYFAAGNMKPGLALELGCGSGLLASCNEVVGVLDSVVVYGK